MSRILECWIVDDEPLALSLLESYVADTPFLRLTGKFSSAKSVISAMMETQPDLVFLDIQMPLLNGMELARLIPEKTKIIFTTAFSEYALEGYKVNAIDYLMKPVSYTQFLLAAKKAVTWHEAAQQEEPTDVDAVSHNNGIFVKTDYKIVHILFDNILYVEGLKNYVKIYLREQSKPIISLMPMKDIEAALPAYRFIRVHRSYIVQKNKIESVNKNRLVINGKEIPIGETYKQNFLGEIEK
ncbi:MAG: LytTR family DNA-binding domain-containing protein, partial [Petrimonas sp.]|nr:LytTR family DNA-binding domain-containing protein [Petrimonas sp.]